MEATETKLIDAPITPEHREEVLSMAEILIKCAAGLQQATTYAEAKVALDGASDAAEAIKDTGFLDVVHGPQPSVEEINELLKEEVVHSGPTGHEGEEGHGEL